MNILPCRRRVRVFYDSSVRCWADVQSTALYS